MKLRTRQRPFQSRRFAQQGLSLVELMVALTIGIFLLGAVGIIYVNTTTTSRSSTLESQMNEDASLALELLQQQVRLAGFSSVDNTGARLFPGQAVSGCDGGFTNNSAAFTALACNAAGAGSDAFSVRYEASVLNSQPTAGGAPGNCAHEGVTTWDATAEGSASNNIALADNRYYIANDVDGTPTLFCQGRIGAAFGNATALIPNIEDMQVLYALTALPANASDPVHHQVAGYANANVASSATAAAPAYPALSGLVVPATLPAGINNWSRVAALRICLVARTARPVPAGDNAITDLGRYVDCNGNVQTPNDRFLRRAYVTTVQLRNMRTALPSDYVPGGYAWEYLYEN